MSHRIRQWGTVLAATAVALALGCGSDEPDPVATATALSIEAAEARAASPPTPGPTSTTEPSPPPSPTPESAEATPEGYSSNAIMFELTAMFGQRTGVDPSQFEATLEAISESQDRSQVPVLIQTIRFLGNRSATAASAVLTELTGQSFGTQWNQWMEWLGKNSAEYRPPDDYADWKLRLYSLIHPRFANFLRDAKETSRIDLTEVVWGGVVPDGIPDLRNPKNLTPEEAEYMKRSDRVFGVSINGEHRAYPLRIINAHEMANDILGGEPISVMW